MKYSFLKFFLFLACITHALWLMFGTLNTNSRYMLVSYGFIFWCFLELSAAWFLLKEKAGVRWLLLGLASVWSLSTVAIILLITWISNGNEQASLSTQAWAIIVKNYLLPHCLFYWFIVLAGFWYFNMQDYKNGKNA
ncbi:MAG: hypothetical protein ING36_06810 [Burkholderiales bacterium]|jgi:hypothetical protein|nr:hypothetical protein [Microcystis sp. M049S1]MCA3159748.1 hypothetical protein [Burkholderiales bacterium]MCA2864776.1 hypothetical protein [Microcystis sp. M049S1]MCA3160606.1 hypothetical protein [Burkholderiales bacterium]MCA3163189.1 hypothetical protein [Burkholderiales bacterium]MCA3166055.1 hypothetical protein [Burkholderiales bacterium]